MNIPEEICTPGKGNKTLTVKFGDAWHNRCTIYNGLTFFTEFRPKPTAMITWILKNLFGCYPMWFVEVLGNPVNIGNGFEYEAKLLEKQYIYFWYFKGKKVKEVKETKGKIKKTW